jgi:glycosyltransferase involved in cell wall biosynthesis
MNPMRVVHIITGLSTGGAEMMLYQLVKQQKQQGIQGIVFSLVSNGDLKPFIQAEGIEVIDLNFPRGKFSPGGFCSLIQGIRAWNPDVVMCWMYHANLIGGLAAKVAGRYPVLWGIHNSTLDAKNSSRMTRMIMRLGGVMSGLAAKIIYCSESARILHQQFHYQKEKGIVIPNGFDISAFKPDTQHRQQFRQTLGIAETQRIIAIIGRYNPQKDFPTFIQAAGLVAKQVPEVGFLFCGQELDVHNEELMNLIKRAGIIDAVYLLGRRQDMPNIQQSIDVLVSSSAYGEAFPMVIGEAMACAVPCVASDVGDARYLIGDTGLVVPPKDAQVLADAIMQMLALPDDQMQKMKQKARQRIVENYSIAHIAERYMQVFEQFKRDL